MKYENCVISFDVWDTLIIDDSDELEKSPSNEKQERISLYNDYYNLNNMSNPLWWRWKITSPSNGKNNLKLGGSLATKPDRKVDWKN